MPLSEEDKRRIYEEELERQSVRAELAETERGQHEAEKEVRDARRKKSAWIVVGTFAVVFGGIAVLGALFSGDTSDYAGGMSGCGHFRNVIRDFGDNLLSENEFRIKLREVRSSVSTAEPAIRDAFSDVLDSWNSADAETFGTAITQMNLACFAAGY